jgi:pyruvate dehydrogenase E2 component (dihydrolipoyllysine-residue acetyltransferase)
MAVSVTLPALGESVSEGTITRWLKAEGEHVEADEPLLEVSTDKVDTEIPAPASGVLASIKVGEDETVEVGSELAVIDDGTGAPSGASTSTSSTGAAASSVAASAPAPAAAAPAPQTPAPAAAAAAAPVSGAEGTAVLLPALGESVSEGTVTRWLKQVGEDVEADEPLLEVSTDKVDTEIPAPASGTLLEILIGEDETAEVGAKLAVIGAPGAAPAPAPAPAAPPTPPTPPTPPAPPAPAPAAQTEAPAPAAVPTPRPTPTVPVQEAPSPAPAPTAPAAPTAADEAAGAYVTPLVRKLAAESGVDLAAVKGTGVGGRIRKQDVIAAAEAARAAAAITAPAAKPAAVTPSPLRGQTVPMTRVRKAIAKHMVESLRVSAQLTTVVEVDVTKIMKLREKAKSSFQQREGVKLSPMPFFVKAAAEALKLHPVVNARVNDDDTITYHDVENIGIAVDTEKGLFVPVIHGAGDLNIAGIAKKTADLASRTREGGLKPDELAGGTFTVTNTGSRGALFDTPILNQPQVGMLGIGATVRRPVVLEADEGTVIGVRDMVYLALSYDHRIVDGADAARFLATVKARLEAGEFESDLGL